MYGQHSIVADARKKSKAGLGACDKMEVRTALWGPWIPAFTGMTS
jgi:hypothetical protein